MLARVFLATAFAAAAAAQSTVLFFTKVPNPVTAGQPQAITYSTNDTSTPVTIKLRKGVSTDLRTISTLTDSATNGQYIWTPDSTLENASDYALQISQGDQLNYYGPFTLQGGGAAATSTSNSASASSSSSTSSTRVIISPSNSTTTSARPPFATSNSTIHSNTSITTTTATTTSSQTSGPSSGAGFQGTTSAASPTDTNAASVMATGSSAVAVLFGAVAAMLFC